MKKITSGLLIIGVACLMATLSACSSSSVGPDDENGDAIPPPTDASTDAVPAPNAENPGDLSAAADPNAQPSAAPTDASAAPPPAPDAAAAPAPMPDAAAAAPAPAPAPDVAQAPAPVPAAPDSAPPASADAGGTGQWDNYTVQAGDTLMKIAFETYGDLYQWKKIFDANKDKFSDPNNIPPGAVLKVEKPANPIEISRNGDKYMIKKGDTLGTIAEDLYGTKTKWKKIWHNNEQLIKDPNRIFAGFYLYYTMTPEERDEADKLHHQVTPAPMADAQTGAARTTASDPLQPVPQQNGIQPMAPAPAGMAPAAPAPAAPVPGAPSMGG